MLPVKKKDEEVFWEPVENCEWVLWWLFGLNQRIS